MVVVDVVGIDVKLSKDTISILEESLTSFSHDNNDDVIGLMREKGRKEMIGSCLSPPASI